MLLLPMILMKLWLTRRLGDYGFNLNDYRRSLRIFFWFCLIYLVPVFFVNVLPHIISGQTLFGTRALYSETSVTFWNAKDWSAQTLGLWYRGQSQNAAETLSVVITDAGNNSVVIENTAEQNAVQSTMWTEWAISLGGIEGIDLSQVTTLAIRIGNPDAQQAGSKGKIYIDDIAIYPQQSVSPIAITITVPNGDFEQIYKPGSDSSDFYAHYTRLAYDDDNNTGKYADIIVNLGYTGQLVFSRQYSYLPFWQASGKKHFVNRIIPFVGDGPAERPDRINKCSYVRIVEDTPDRIIVHWRYAPDQRRDSYWRTGVSGSSLSFDGYTNRVTVPASSVPQISHGFTIQAWIAPQDRRSCAWRRFRVRSHSCNTG